MALPESIINYINSLNTSDIIRLHILVDERYQQVKAITKNFPAAKYAVLHPDKTLAQKQKQRDKNKNTILPTKTDI